MRRECRARRAALENREPARGEEPLHAQRRHGDRAERRGVAGPVERREQRHAGAAVGAGVEQTVRRVRPRTGTRNARRRGEGRAARQREPRPAQLARSAAANSECVKPRCWPTRTSQVRVATVAGPPPSAKASRRARAEQRPARARARLPHGRTRTAWLQPRYPRGMTNTTTPDPALPSFTEWDALADFERRDLTFLGQTQLVYVAGTGPAVIVMTEMPGIYPPGRALRALGARRRLHGLDAAPLRRRRPAARRSRYGLLEHDPRLHQPRVPRLRRQRVEPGHRLAARARGARAPALRRQGRRRDRHVLHRQLRALDDARARRARAGALRSRRCRSGRRAACTSRPTSSRGEGAHASART